MSPLRRQAGFYALAVTLLATGLTAVTVLFAVADALLLRPLAVRQPEQLVRVTTTKPRIGARSAFRWEMFEAWRKQATAFAEVGAAAEVNAAYRDGEQMERAQVAITSAEWFTVFGVQPAVGTLPAGEDGAVLSHHFWQRRYGGREVLGRRVEIRGQAFTITGVLPAGFNGATVESGPDLRIGTAALARYAADPMMRELYWEVVARVKPAVVRQAARDEAFRIHRNAAQPELDDVDLAARDFDLEPLAYGASRLRAQAGTAIWFATGAAALLALMVCVNLSGLMLARVMGREHEFAVRQALGARRAQLAWLVLKEVLVTVGAALLVAGALTTVGLQWLSAVLPPVRLLGRNVVPMALHLEADARVLAFAAAGSLVALCLIALLPAWRASRSSFVTASTARRATAGYGGRRWLLAAQAALCTMLMLAALLVKSSLDQLRGQQTAAAIVNCDVDSLLVPGMKPERFARAMEQWKQKVEALPGVRKAAFSGVRRLRGSGLKFTVVPAGERAQPAQFLNANSLPVSEGYLEVNGIPLLAGRELTEAERYGKAVPKAVVVNESFARQHGGPAAVLGRRFGSARPGQVAAADFVVVGVAGNFVYRNMREFDVPVVYGALGGNWSPLTLSVRAEQPAAVLAGALREALRQVAPELTVEEITDLRADVEASLWNERAVAWVSTLFAGMAAAMVAAGLFAFVSYLAAARRREVGIRVAIGATPGQVVALVLAEGLWPLAGGVAVGLGAGWMMGRVAESFLFGVRPGDPVATALIAAAMLITGTLACLAPAWRASRVSPAVALRAE